MLRGEDVTGILVPPAHTHTHTHMLTQPHTHVAHRQGDRMLVTVHSHTAAMSDSVNETEMTFIPAPSSLFFYLSEIYRSCMCVCLCECVCGWGFVCV